MFVKDFLNSFVKRITKVTIIDRLGNQLYQGDYEPICKRSNRFYYFNPKCFNHYVYEIISDKAKGLVIVIDND